MFYILGQLLKKCPEGIKENKGGKNGRGVRLTTHLRPVPS
jgi:hypothetical protein